MHRFLPMYQPRRKGRLRQVLCPKFQTRLRLVMVQQVMKHRLQPKKTQSSLSLNLRKLQRQNQPKRLQQSPRRLRKHPPVSSPLKSLRLHLKKRRNLSNRRRNLHKNRLTFPKIKPLQKKTSPNQAHPFGVGLFLLLMRTKAHRPAFEGNGNRIPAAQAANGLPIPDCLTL